MAKFLLPPHEILRTGKIMINVSSGYRAGSLSFAYAPEEILNAISSKAVQKVCSNLDTQYCLPLL